MNRGDYYADYCLKCTYTKGIWNDEKWVTINVNPQRHPEGGSSPKYSFATFDDELTLAGNDNALIRLLGIKKLDDKWAQVMAREMGNPRYFIVPLDELVKNEVPK